MSTITKDLGVVTAYGYYKAGGGTMTEAEFTQFMVDFGTASKTAVDAAEAALESERAAKESEETATSKASEADESATTASTKAGEAAQSASEANTAKEDAVTAKTAAETAQGKAEDAQAAAEAVAESIPSDYSQLSEDVTELKENFTAMNTDINPNNNGEFVWPLRYGYWSTGTGTPVWTPTNKFLASAYPIKVKNGDVIHLKDTKNIRYFAAKSTDGVAWSALVNTIGTDCAITEDGYVLVSARKEPNSLSFTADDEKIFFDNYLTIVRKNPTDNISKEVGNINTASGILINIASYKQSYVSNISAADVTIPLSLVFPATAGDTFEISAESLAATVHPEYYSNIKLAVYEVYNGSTVWTSLYDITDPVTYTVKNANTDSISLIAKLVKESTSSVLSGYYENIEFNIFAVKKTEDLTDAMTESGSIWEV